MTLTILDPIAAREAKVHSLCRIYYLAAGKDTRAWFDKALDRHLKAIPADSPYRQQAQRQIELARAAYPAEADWSQL